MSRDTTKVHPELQEIIKLFLADCESQGLKVGISECLRTKEEQDKLYAQGRTTPGNIVTNAKGSSYSSMHQWGVAFDFYRNDGKGAYNDSDNFFHKVGQVGKKYGLIWGGDWTSPVDKPHFQLSDWGDTPKKLKELYGTPEKFIATWKDGSNNATSTKPSTATNTNTTQQKTTVTSTQASGTLKMGSTGSSVTTLQTNLKTLGYDCKGVDGQYGTNTKKAVIAFQKANGLEPDGIAGPKTQAKIKTLLEKKKEAEKKTSANQTAILKEGSEGNAVTTLQKNLLALGYNPKGVDGDFGKNTKAAVIAFQKANGLTPDGIVGPKTKAKMDELLKKKNAKAVNAQTKQTVVHSATLKCTLGTTTSKLLIPVNHGAKLNNKNVAVITDHKTGVNLTTFGSCKCSSPPPACIPSVSGDWLNGDSTYKVKSIKTVTTKSKCICARGGCISITASGQNTAASTKSTKDVSTPATSTSRSTDSTSSKKVPMIGDVENLGVLSGKFEARSDPGTISSGSGDSGGKSYGVYQFASSYNVPLTFAKWLKDKNSIMSEKLLDAYEKDGNKFGENFDTEWKNIASTNKTEFEKLQYQYTKAQYYDKAAATIKKDTGFDFNTQGYALKNVLFSRAVQHGAGGSVTVVERAISKLDLKTATDKQIIEAIYKESGAVDASIKGRSVITNAEAKNYSGVYGYSMKYFSKNSSNVQWGVWKRLNVTEPAAAIELLNTYN